VEAAEAAGAAAAAPGARVELRRARALWAAAGYLPDNPLVRRALVQSYLETARCVTAPARHGRRPHHALRAVCCAMRISRPVTSYGHRSLSSPPLWRS